MQTDDIRAAFNRDYPDYANLEHPTADTPQDAKSALFIYTEGWQAALHRPAPGVDEQELRALFKTRMEAFVLQVNGVPTIDIILDDLFKIFRPYLSLSQQPTAGDVERVAKAIYEAECITEDDETTDWRQCPEDWREGYLRNAKAAIAALTAKKEPAHEQ